MSVSDGNSALWEVWGKKKKNSQRDPGGVFGVFGVENSKTHQNMQVYKKTYGLLSLCYSCFSELAASPLMIPTMFKPPKECTFIIGAADLKEAMLHLVCPV